MKYYVPSGQYLSYRINGAILLVVSLLVASAVLYFPVIRPNLQKQAEVKEKIEQNTPDYVFSDISELSTKETAYDQTKRYDGKVVSFTGYINETDQELISKGFAPQSYAIYNKSHSDMYSDTPRVYCEVPDPEKTFSQYNFKDNDKVKVIGEVYWSDWYVHLRYCVIEPCD